MKLGDPALTIEVEAMLINRFRPRENKVLFEAYPDIAGGMRAKGYSHSELSIESLPARLTTDPWDWAALFVVGDDDDDE